MKINHAAVPFTYTLYVHAHTGSLQKCKKIAHMETRVLPPPPPLWVFFGLENFVAGENKYSDLSLPGNKFSGCDQNENKKSVPTNFHSPSPNPSESNGRPLMVADAEELPTADLLDPLVDELLLKLDNARELSLDVVVLLLLDEG